MKLIFFWAFEEIRMNDSFHFIYRYFRYISHLSEIVFIPLTLHAYFEVVMLLSLFTFFFFISVSFYC